MRDSTYGASFFHGNALMAAASFARCVQLTVLEVEKPLVERKLANVDAALQQGAEHAQLEQPQDRGVRERGDEPGQRTGPPT